MRFRPKTLWGKLVLVLLTGLVFAQLLSAFVLLRDRGQTLYEAVQQNLIARTASIVHLMDSLEAANRQYLLPLLNAPELSISFSHQAETLPEENENSKAATQLIKKQLTQRLSPGSKVLVTVIGSVMNRSMPEMRHQHTTGLNPKPEPWAFMHGMHAMVQSFLIQVQLRDGSWIRFERDIPENFFDWPSRLIWVLGILLVSVAALSLIAVRSIIRPLNELKTAAEGLGRDIHRSPLPVKGPVEISETAKAFNTMQSRLKSFIEDRARILAAVSHDLKTPLTRLRLRTDLLEDKVLRHKFETDLNDMESMVNATLDFMRGVQTQEPTQTINLMALLDSISENAIEVGHDVQVIGSLSEPYNGKPIALKRCIENLVENAVSYGERAIIRIEEDKNVIISVLDEGPGIPEEQLEAVFDPFFRLESSRAKKSGGTGLGLGIARNIAKAHGGDLQLANRPEGGIKAALTLPK
jgi:signal transduction histidine kinase